MNLLAIAVLFLALTFSAFTAEISPEQVARETTDKIIVLLKENKDAYAKDTKKLYAMVGEHVLQNFDFRAMSRTVLGRYWRDAGEEQRARFTGEFRDLLVRTYATALLKYNNEKIVYLPFKFIPDDRTTTVKSEVRRTDGGPTIAINYSFYRTDAGWKVYDVTIEGASLVTTYQSTYAARIQKEGLDTLINGLKKENKPEVEGKTAANGGKESKAK